uniref:Uncharacterized protein n=1 Tax=Manihot esculenta TaxID=3983 RepID=A0A2C9WGU5_MANES
MQRPKRLTSRSDFNYNYIFYVIWVYQTQFLTSNNEPLQAQKKEKKKKKS